jgi:hypothetical protein
VVDEGAFAVDLDYGQPLAVTRLEVRIVGDVDFRVRDAFRIEHRARALAQVAAARGVEDDLVDYG